MLRKFVKIKTSSWWQRRLKSHTAETWSPHDMLNKHAVMWPRRLCSWQDGLQSTYSASNSASVHKTSRRACMQSDKDRLEPAFQAKYLSNIAAQKLCTRAQYVCHIKSIPILHTPQSSTEVNHNILTSKAWRTKAFLRWSSNTWSWYQKLTSKPDIR